MPEATAAPAPPLEPPVECSVFQGFRLWAVGIRFGRRHSRKLGGVGLAEEDEARGSEFSSHIGVFFCGPAKLFQKAAALMIGVASRMTAKVLEEKRDAAERPVG